MEEKGRGKVGRVGRVAVRVVARVQGAWMGGARGGCGAGEEALAAGEPAEELADKDGLLPAAVSEAFGIDLAEAYFVGPAVDADAARTGEGGVVGAGGDDGDTAAEDVALEDAEEDEHGACLCIAGAGLADGGGDGETGGDEGLEDGEEERRREVGRVVEGEGEPEGAEERVERGQHQQMRGCAAPHGDVHDVCGCAVLLDDGDVCVRRDPRRRHPPQAVHARTRRQNPHRAPRRVPATPPAVGAPRPRPRPRPADAPLPDPHSERHRLCHRDTPSARTGARPPQHARPALRPDHHRQFPSLRVQSRPRLLASGPHRGDCALEKRLETHHRLAGCLWLRLSVSLPCRCTRTHLV